MVRINRAGFPVVDLGSAGDPDEVTDRSSSFRRIDREGQWIY